MTPTTTRTRKAAAVRVQPDLPLPDDLVPTANGTPPPAPPVLAMLPVSSLRPGPHNPRSDLGDLEGLANSIRALGILEPLVVEQVGPTEYLVLAGHRRLAAAKLAELTEVPCVCRTRASTEAERMEMALVENLQREDLAPLDEAKGYALLVKLGLSQRAIADRVGCSQSHVSKRLALLELPSHVRARVAKGTMPLEAAAALVKLVDHPDKLKAAAGEDPSAIVAAVERAEKVIEWEAKRAELVEIAKGNGWAVVDDPGQPWKPHAFKTLASWDGYAPELDLPVNKHDLEPCHGVLIPGDPPPYVHAMPSATSICTDPERHGPKGASTLKVKGSVKAAKRPLSTHEVKERENDKQRVATGKARVAVLAKAVAAHRNTRGPSPAALALTLRALVDMANAETTRVACQILGLDAGPAGHTGALRKAAEGDDHQLHRAAMAVALASTEARLRWNWSNWSWPDVPGYFAYLAELGYQPTPWEQEKLAEAAKG